MRESNASRTLTKKWIVLFKELGVRSRLYKICDRFTKGIPDTLGSIGGKAAGIEFKVISDLPKRPTSMVLTKHEFTSKQLLELTRIQDTGGIALGVIIFKAKGYQIPDFTKKNFTREEFLQLKEVEWISLLKKVGFSLDLMRLRADQPKLLDGE